MHGGLMSVFSVKMRRELREKVEKYGDRVNWPEEVRRFIEWRVREVGGRGDL
jgi:hypothetical protein